MELSRQVAHCDLISTQNALLSGIKPTNFKHHRSKWVSLVARTATYLKNTSSGPYHHYEKEESCRNGNNKLQATATNAKSLSKLGVGVKERDEWIIDEWEASIRQSKLCILVTAVTPSTKHRKLLIMVSTNSCNFKWSRERKVSTTRRFGLWWRHPLSAATLYY